MSNLADKRLPNLVGAMLGRLSRETLGAEHTARLAARAARTRLSLDRWRSVVESAGRRPRIAATACWSFPIYSQTFVYEELTQLLRGGFDVRFLYSELASRDELGGRYGSLWRRKRRTQLAPQVAGDDVAWFRRVMPARVDAVTSMLCEASGMTREALERDAHFTMAFSFARLVDSYRPDYLHSYFFYEGTLFTLVASQLLGIPRGVSCYADHMLGDYRLKVLPLHLRTCDIVVATSERIRRELASFLPGESVDNVVVKPNAIDIARFPDAERPEPGPGEPFRIVSVSRLEPKKGLEHLVDAVSLLRDRGFTVVLHLVGAEDELAANSREYTARLRTRVHELALGDRVIFEGRCSQPEVLRHLQESHVFAAPFVELESGDKDGIPTVLLEAMATRIAVLTTDSGSMTEVVEDGRNGVVVPQRDPVALADALARLLANRSLRDGLGRAAVATIRDRFDVRVTEGPLHRRIREVIAARRGAARG